MARDRGLAQWVIYTSTWVHNHRTQSINWSINQSLIPGSSIDLGTSQGSVKDPVDFIRSRRGVRESNEGAKNVQFSLCIWAELPKNIFKDGERLGKIFCFDLWPLYPYAHTGTHIWTHKQKYKEGGGGGRETVWQGILILEKRPRNSVDNSSQYCLSSDKGFLSKCFKLDECKTF